MKQWTYLLLLVVSLGGLAIADWRYRLAFWQNWRATAKTLASCMMLFVMWDLLGIRLGIFMHGGSPYSLPLRLAPEFPLEELFFLALLSYVTLITYQGGLKLWQRTSS